MKSHCLSADFLLLRKHKKWKTTEFHFLKTLKGILPGGPKSRLWDHGGSPFENHQFSKFWLHFKVSESSNVFWGNRNPTTISKSTEEEISCPSPILQCNKINVFIERWCWDCTWPYYLLNFVLSLRTSLLVQCDHQKKIWYPHLISIHLEIFRLLRAFAVKSGFIFGKWNQFAFELNCGPRSWLEVSKLCEVDYKYFGTHTQTN